MIAVLFEVTLKAKSKAEYLSIAKQLKEILIDMDGFISIERYQNITDNSRLLSLSFWKDEASIKAWRNQAEHQIAQKLGKNHLFEHYRIRVADVLRDYQM